MHRTIVEEARFREELAAIEPDVRRSDDALRYVYELLARDATVGMTTFSPEIRVAPIVLPDAAGRRRDISLFYIVRDTTVHLVSAKLD
ncbi:hypothetical protein [Conexibacter arvalis]|uniref:Uncharacterized protein n=1 Tax=Conexibacter arvalis TaxID=912552 RepID=A0A840IJK2_9ACTN|nr:hypothetical protein [Conexibacter arvalis]MBB4664204.1 hypothetical protein [Conexibacter arvalis]